MFGKNNHHHDHHSDSGPMNDAAYKQDPLRPGRGRAMAGARGQGRQRGGPSGFGVGPRGHGGGFGPGGPMFGRGGRGLRRGRGDVRAAILRLLSEEPMHGYQMIQELTERSEGTWRPSPGSVYPTLSALEDEGLVKVEKSDGKRIFHLTDAGHAAVEKLGDQPPPWEDANREDDAARSLLREQLGQLGAATVQVAQAGTESQITQAQTILSEARRRLYLLLAEDPAQEEATEPATASE